MSDDTLNPALELLTQQKDAPSLADFAVQLVGGGVDDARALLRGALAHLGETPPAAAEVPQQQLAGDTNGLPHAAKRSAEDGAAGEGQGSAKVARQESANYLAAAEAPPPGGSDEVVDLTYFKMDEADEGDSLLMLLVPDSAVSTIIGKSGVTIKQIQTSTEIKIDIQTSAEMVPGQHERRVSLKGSIKNTNIGSYLVGMKAQEKLASHRPGSEMPMSMKILVPNQSVSFIIGKQGVMINEIQNTSGGRIQIEKAAEMLPGLGGRVVTISGPPRARLMAQYLISRALAQHAALPASASPPNGHGGHGGHGGNGGGGRAPSSAGPQVSLEIFVQNNLVARLIGKQGKNITELQSNSGVRVQIQKESEMAVGQTERMVTLIGMQASVSNCHQMINKQLSEWQAVHGIVPSAAGGAPASGPGGANYPPPSNYAPRGQQPPAAQPAAVMQQQLYRPPGAPAAAGPAAVGPPGGQPVYYQPTPGYGYAPHAMQSGMVPQMPAAGYPPAQHHAQYPGYHAAAQAQAHAQAQAQAQAQAAAQMQQHYQYQMPRPGSSGNIPGAANGGAK